MKGILKKWSSISLILRIVIGIVTGTILGLVFPGFKIIPVLGTVFVGALKGVAPVLVFVLVISSIANASGEIGARFRTVIFLYMFSTLLAAITAVLGCFLFPVTVNLSLGAADGAAAPEGLGEVLGNLLSNMVANPINAISGGNYIGILFWAVIFGLSLKSFAGEQTKKVLSDFADMTSQAVRWIIQMAPFGILGLVFSVVSENGLGIFYDYGRLLILLVGCMLLVALVINPVIVFAFLRENPYPLVLRCIRESGITAFFTRSSAANIPVNMTLCEKLGLDKDFYSVSIPLGATINMNGAAVTITVMALTIVHTMGISVDIPSAILLSIIATFAACGASGVAGGSLLLIPLACSLFGVGNDIAMQGVAIGFIIGVIQDSVETALNSSADVLFAATAEFHDRKKRTTHIA
ncbi:MAG: serine/threonine transporter SstT [Eubacteriales bacterium]|nr:serine/threonine transporter SstT [Eubacteriales bacterium]